MHKAYLVSCVNSRASDLHSAAEVIRNHMGGAAKVKNGVQLYVSAASLLVQREAESNGDWQTLMEAGAIPLPSGCGPCIGTSHHSFKTHFLSGNNFFLIPPTPTSNAFFNLFA